MAKFYAFDNIWGVGFRGRDGERLGTVVAFWSRTARNEWVNTESLRNGVYHREIISAKVARCEMIRVAYDYMLNRRVVWGRGDLRYLPMGTLTEAYARATL